MTSSTGREITMPCAGVFSPQEVVMADMISHFFSRGTTIITNSCSSCSEMPKYWLVSAAALHHCAAARAGSARNIDHVVAVAAGYRNPDQGEFRFFLHLGLISFLLLLNCVAGLLVEHLHHMALHAADWDGDGNAAAPLPERELLVQRLQSGRHHEFWQDAGGQQPAGAPQAENI